MCRWLAYRGRPLRVEELLYKTKHSLIEQSRHAKLGLETFNGDGFGLGWYGDGDSSARPPSDLGPDVAARMSSDPGLYRSLMPAWSNHNLQSLAAHVVSPFFLAHVRATTGTPVQETNCHPFRHENWLFAHNGSVTDYLRVRQALVLAIAPEYFNVMHGSTDSEVMFCLALTFGLREEPIPALERMAGFVERVGHDAGIEYPLQMTLGVADGERLYAVRYSSVGQSRTLFSSADARALRALHPENERLQELTGEDRAVVSEPLTDPPGLWLEVPEATVLTVQDGPDAQRPFTPTNP